MGSALYILSRIIVLYTDKSFWLGYFSDEIEVSYWIGKMN